MKGRLEVYLTWDFGFSKIESNSNNGKKHNNLEGTDGTYPPRWWSLETGVTVSVPENWGQHEAWQANKVPGGWWGPQVVGS